MGGSHKFMRASAERLQVELFFVREVRNAKSAPEVDCRDRNRREIGHSFSDFDGVTPMLE
jgi:hypothetical protein